MSGGPEDPPGAWTGRRIAHLDMDAFFASVELLSRPQLRGLPVVVGGGRRRGTDPEGRFRRLREYVGRGVATTATYEARAFGVHSGMGLMKAAALAPDAILLPADFEAYSRCSRLFKAAVRTATGLTCSIGVTPNKLLSKLASELQKPDGLTVLTLADLPGRIWPLPASALNGVGPKASARLEAMGLRTIGEVAGTDMRTLVAAFGHSYGTWLWEAAHGVDDRPVVTEREIKSVSRETTFERDLHPRRDRETLTWILVDLCTRLGGDLERKGVLGRTIGVKLRYDDFRTVTRDHTLERATADPREILDAARFCLRRVSLDRPLRLLGVRVGTLVATGPDESGNEDPFGPGARALPGMLLPWE